MYGLVYSKREDAKDLIRRVDAAMGVACETQEPLPTKDGKWFILLSYSNGMHIPSVLIVAAQNGIVRNDVEVAE